MTYVSRKRFYAAQPFELDGSTYWRICCWTEDKPVTGKPLPGAGWHSSRQEAEQELEALAARFEWIAEPIRRHAK